MNDERNNKKSNIIKTNKIINASNTNNSSERLIAEATKILLKNGLNGASAEAVAAAAKFLNATTNAFSFQPPTLPPYTINTTITDSSLLPSNKLPSLEHKGNYPDAFSRSLHRTAVESLNNGLSLRTKGSILSSLPASSDKKYKAIKNMAAITAKSSTAPVVHGSICVGLDTSIKMAHGGGVIDYTLNNIRNQNNTKNNYETHVHNKSDLNRSHIAGLYGGRLQFFKDGKFILELARAKEGEKSGWVSVPRKSFRTSSTISSTITPTSAGSLIVYPKNESSTSLSFSDDNSSVQSSPWQRDHCWKQTAPKRNHSVEMSLYFYRPTDIRLTKSAFQMTQKKRRQPLNKVFLRIGLNIFEEIGIMKSNDKNKTTIKIYSQDSSTNLTDNKDESIYTDSEKNIKQENIENKDEISKIVNNDNLENSLHNEETKNEKTNNNEVSKTTTTTTKTSMKKLDTSINFIKTEAINTETHNIIIYNNKSEDKIQEKPLIEVKKIIAPNRLLNTSEDVEEKPQIQVEQKKEKTTYSKEDDDNSEINGYNINTKMVIINKEMKIGEANNGREIKIKKKRQRLKVFKNRAKLENIVQKLNQRNTIISEEIQQQQQKLLVSPNITTKISTSTNSTDMGINANENGISSRNILQNKGITTTTASNRLMVDFHHQHISPRKRILREFEKVSLEDKVNLGVNTIGGKRLRAKPLLKTTATTTSLVGVTSTPTVISSKSPTYNQQNCSKDKISTTPINKTTNTISSSTTRLYSSYSINALLGDGNSNDKHNIHTHQPNTTHKMHYHHQQKQQHVEVATSETAAATFERDNFMPSSPLKSPDNNHVTTTHTEYSCGGGKSPSNTILNRKRSPPYVAASASPVRDVHAQSHIFPMSMTPTPIMNSHQYHNYHHHQQQQHLLLAERQKFHAPNMLSLKSTGTARQNATVISDVISTFSATPSLASSPSAAAASKAINYNIPTQHMSASSSSTSSNCSSSSLSPQQHLSQHQLQQQQQKLSSIYSSTSSDHLSPPSLSHTNDCTTPRTVPKKTASIRRQFASPTHSNSSQTTTVTGNNDEASVNYLSTAQKQHLQHQQQQWLHHHSNNQTAGGNNHTSLHYYMYPPVPSTTGTPSNVICSSAGGTGVVTAAAAAAYIPYYHPYFTTLAALRQSPLWMHHYPGAMISHHPPLQLPQTHHLVAPVCNSSSSNNNNINNSNNNFLANYNNNNNSIVRMNNKLTKKNAEYQIDTTTATTVDSNNTFTAAAADSKNQTGKSAVNNKEEHSSDLPLNLSKPKNL